MVVSSGHRSFKSRVAGIFSKKLSTRSDHSVKVEAASLGNSSRDNDNLCLPPGDSPSGECSESWGKQNKPRHRKRLLGKMKKLINRRWFSGNESSFPESTLLLSNDNLMEENDSSVAEACKVSHSGLRSVARRLFPHRPRYATALEDGKMAMTFGPAYFSNFTSDYKKVGTPVESCVLYEDDESTSLIDSSSESMNLIEHDESENHSRTLDTAIKTEVKMAQDYHFTIDTNIEDISSETNNLEEFATTDFAPIDIMEPTQTEEDVATAQNTKADNATPLSAGHEVTGPEAATVIHARENDLIGTPQNSAANGEDSSLIEDVTCDKRPQDDGRDWAASRLLASMIGVTIPEFPVSVTNSTSELSALIQNEGPSNEAFQLRPLRLAPTAQLGKKITLEELFRSDSPDTSVASSTLSLGKHEPSTPNGKISLDDHSDKTSPKAALGAIPDLSFEENMTSGASGQKLEIEKKSSEEEVEAFAVEDKIFQNPNYPIELQNAFTEINGINSPIVAHTLKKTIIKFRQDFQNLLNQVVSPCDENMRILIHDLWSIRIIEEEMFSLGNGLKQVFSMIKVDFRKNDTLDWNTELANINWQIGYMDYRMDIARASLAALRGMFDLRLMRIFGDVNKIREMSNPLGWTYELFCRLNHDKLGSVDVHACTLASAYSTRAMWHYHVDFDKFKTLLINEFEYIGLANESVGMLINSVKEGFADIARDMKAHYLEKSGAELMNSLEPESGAPSVCLVEPHIAELSPEIPPTTKHKRRRKRNNAARNERRKQKNKPTNHENTKTQKQSKTEKTKKKTFKDEKDKILANGDKNFHKLEGNSPHIPR